jgi:hypothetical protein
MVVMLEPQAAGHRVPGLDRAVDHEVRGRRGGGGGVGATALATLAPAQGRVEAVWRLGPDTVRRGWEAHARPTPSGKVGQASLGEMRLIISDDPSGDTWGYPEP